MKAFQKFLHLSLIAAILLATSGFRVNLDSCHGADGGLISFSASPACCCDKSAEAQKSPPGSCNDLSCIVQAGFSPYPTQQVTSEQAARCLKAPVAYVDFSQAIRPALLERTPHFTLPPPVSGRFIGILHQTFIV
jgi:hypothetical protein